MKTVHEVSALTGVSVRTLHHYDAIGLLHPTRVTEAGYRLYDDAAIARLGTILLFRELEFPLKEIKAILDTPGFDRREALTQQIRMLELRREHIDRLIRSARTLQKQGGNRMDFSAFDRSEMDACAAEAKQRWGNTDVYREQQKKTAGKSREELQQTGGDLMQIFAEFGGIRAGEPASPDAQALAGKLQQFITDHYYTCTREILAGLGQMYTSDDRFKANIDASGGPGTAEFAAKAIAEYCK